MRDEIARRQSNVQKLREFFVARPGEWIPAADLEVAGRQAWRTRVSELRVKLERDGHGTIENRIAKTATATASFYRYLPHVPLARDAADFAPASHAAADAPFAEPFQLTPPK